MILFRKKTINTSRREVKREAYVKTETKKFDLNIEKILEDWKVYHAIREVIANAIDEQILTHTQSIKIWKDSKGKWHIRDFGRGLRYEHLTQNENKEKLENPKVIGKFGIGLKDALATFDRHGVKVFIKSKYGDITIGKSQKYGFKDIITLHAYINPPSDPNFVGTEFVLDGVTDDDINKAKDLFLIFSGERVVEVTKYGEVLEKKGSIARIYVNGVKVAEEDNFLFSYNITSITKKIKQALNRERSNVGRTAYSDRVKAILLSSKSKEVAMALMRDIEKYSMGKIHDELKWIDVQMHAVKILNAEDKVVFFTYNEISNIPDMVDEAKSGGFKVIAIPENLKLKIRGVRDVNGNLIREFTQYQKEYMENFTFKFVKPEELTESELEVFNRTEDIFSLIGGKPDIIKEIKISETMVKDPISFHNAVGLWEPPNIIIKREQLKSLSDYAAILLHETAHALSGARDVTRDFEHELTKLLGILAEKALKEDQK